MGCDNRYDDNYWKSTTPSHPDGWKDEEADVDDFPIKKVKPMTYDNVKKVLVNSAQPCGCDPGAKWHCVYYPNCAFGRSEVDKQ